MVFNSNTIPDVNATFYGHVIANYHIVLNKDVAVDVTVTTYFGARKHDRKLPNLCPSPYIGALNIRKGMNYRAIFHF